MPTIRESVRRLFAPVQPIPPGTYHYQAPPDDPRNYRLHLRLEADGKGILIVNAATVLHLNQTAAEYAYYLVQNVPKEQVIREMISRYQVNYAQALEDYKDFVDRIDILVTTTDLDPIIFLDFDRQAPYSGEISAPYRLDCALTYKIRDLSDSTAAPTKRVTRELTTAEWQTVLDKAWEVGIPHIIFTGGEPTLRDDLVQLITHAEANGQVTGLLTDGFRLVEADYLNTLLQTGLDHFLIILHPEKESAWTALANALAEDIFTSVHLTLTSENTGEVPKYLERLAEMGVNDISLSANAPDLSDELQAARQLTAELDLSLIWDIPVPYSPLNPVALEIEQEEEEQFEGPGRAWLYVEPDGDVLPTQGINKVLGNFLTDPWEEIWSPK